MKTKALFTAIIIFFAQSLLLSQENSWQLTLANGDKISMVSLKKLEGDSIAITFSNTKLTKWVPVDSIVELRKIKKSMVWKSIAIGTLAGTWVGILIGLSRCEKASDSPIDEIGMELCYVLSPIGHGITLGLAGSLVGGIVGAFLGADEIYKLSQLGHEQKLNTISELLGDQSPTN